MSNFWGAYHCRQPDFSALNRFFYAYRELGDKEYALFLAKEIYRKCCMTANAPESGMADALRNLTTTYLDCGKADDALRAAKEYYGICKAFHRNWDLPAATHSIAVAYGLCGDTRSAIKTECESYQCFLRLDNRFMSNFLDIFDNIIKVYTSAGEPEEIIILLLKAITDFEMCRESPDTVSKMLRLANAYSISGQAEKRTLLLETAEEKQRQCCEYYYDFGESNPKYLFELETLADICLLSGKTNDALGMLEKIYLYRLRFIEKNHPLTATVFDKLLNGYEKIGASDKARQLLMRNRKA